MDATEKPTALKYGVRNKNTDTTNTIQQKEQQLYDVMLHSQKECIHCYDTGTQLKQAELARHLQPLYSSRRGKSREFWKVF